ncbi:hypothetical protein MML48_2g00015767 [Holotrichia oblita]|uniref:Uncharacterized protein n=1 Tax=Holotrichia oblita TaxID=644536 RepID=A0ACB9TLQ5_HOLOL|nr:hypothetical protein MML48_2g00015767 [Holotrichia oblita]
MELTKSCFSNREQSYYRKLRNQYKRFLEEDRRRQERNERIMRILERTESRAAILAAKTERFEFLRQQYQAYLQRIFFSTKHTCESAQTPHIPEVSIILEEKPDLNNYGVLSKTSHGDNFEGINHPAHLYEHPIVRKALSGNKGDGTLHPKADVVKQYLRSLSSPISGEEVLKATRSSEKISPLHTSELADSNSDCLYKDDYPYYKTNAGNIADQIINSINSRPKLSSPYHDRFATSPHHLDQNRSKLSEKTFCSTTYSPKRSVEKINYDVEVFNEKDLRYKFPKDEMQFPSKSKEISKRSEVSFQKFSGEKDNRIFASEIPKISVEEMEDDDGKMVTVDDEVLETSDLKERRFINESYQVNDTETDADEHHGMDKVQIGDHIEYGTIPPLDDSAQEPVKDDHEIIEKSEIEDISEETDEKGKSAISDEKYIVTTDKLHDKNTVNKDISQYHQIVKEYQEPEQDITAVALADYEDPQYREHNNQPTLDYQDEPLTGQYTELNACDNMESKFQNDHYDINVHDTGATNIEPQQVVLEKDVDRDDNDRVVHEIMQHVKDNNESKQFIAKNVEKYDDRNQTEAHNKNGEQVPNQKNSDHFATELEDNQLPILHNKDAKAAEQPTVQHHEQNQPVTQYDERDDADMQYDEQGRPLIQYDEKGQPLMQYDEKDQHLMHYNKEDVSIMQYDEKGQPLIQYDERGQPITQYDQDGQFIYQYDQNGQPIMQYDDNGQPLIQYDENGQPIMQYDDRSQPTLQYDEQGQPIMQYDENGQPIMQYDTNGQPILQYNYDENGQPLMYDQQGQPMYQYENQEYYAENQMYNAQQYSEEPQTVTEHPSKDEVPPKEEKQSNSTEKAKDSSKQQLSQNITETNSNAEISSKEELPVNSSKQQPPQPTSPDNEKKINRSEKSKDNSNQQNLKQNSPNKEKKANVMDMLDTDTESIRQESKVSNDSDFDFSSK